MTSPIYMHPDTLKELREIIDAGELRLPDSVKRFLPDPPPDEIEHTSHGPVTRRAFIEGLELRTSDFIPPGKFFDPGVLPPPLAVFKPPTFKPAASSFVGDRAWRYGFAPVRRDYLFYGFDLGAPAPPRLSFAERRRDRKRAAKKARRLHIRAENARRAGRL